MFPPWVDILFSLAAVLFAPITIPLGFVLYIFGLVR